MQSLEFIESQNVGGNLKKKKCKKKRITYFYCLTLKLFFMDTKIIFQFEIRCILIDLNQIFPKLGISLSVKRYIKKNY